MNDTDYYDGTNSPPMPKKPQKANLNGVQQRDLFQTPNYATELLMPFIPSDVFRIWECASGEDKIARVLIQNYFVYATDLSKDNINFLDVPLDYHKTEGFDAIVTNPPYSLKDKFIMKAVEFDLPFAMLIPFAMSKFLATCFTKYGCQGIVPTSRINYITPTGLDENGGHTAYFHSFWLTRKFHLYEQLSFVDITKEQRKNV